MTNKIMQNNSLYNINQNKVLQDKLSTQMSTQKKLTRPSDDPIVAIRALRLRSSVSELTQYYKKNAPDAESWMKVTSNGLETVTDILTNLSTNANKANNKDLTPDDLDIILTQMRSLTNEFYSTGDLDYAGRYVFTGFRTDTPMTFSQTDISKGIIPDYDITEQISIANFDVINHTANSSVEGISSDNYSGKYATADEFDIENGDIHRIRLAYDKLDENTTPTITVRTLKGDADKESVTGVVQVSINDTPNPYERMLEANKDKSTELILYIPETGEILFSDGAYDALEAKLDANEENEIRISYTKNEWANGDLRPEHYFACTANGIDYNKEYLDKNYNERERQNIEYDVGYNQTIQVNTTADEVFTHNLTRDMDDLENALSNLKSMFQSKQNMEYMYRGMKDTDPDYEMVGKQIDAINKAYDYLRENIHNMMGSAITKTQTYLDTVNVAVTDNGTRASRLNLISNRLMEQETTFKTLQSENEDVDIADVAINLSSAELTYEASLTATSKIMQTSLMNYI